MGSTAKIFGFCAATVLLIGALFWTYSQQSHERRLADYRSKQEINAVAAQFVPLALQFDKYDSGYVDAYIGPKAQREFVKENPMTLEQVSQSADALAARLETVRPQAVDPNRLRLLKGNMLAMRTRIAMTRGERFTFDEETRRIYGAVAPKYTLAQFEQALAVEAAAGERAEPVIIPNDKVEAAMSMAIKACRERTRAHYDLPSMERFQLQFVTGKSWSAYNWYKGDNMSVIQVNLDQPLRMDRLLDLGCHEGYPGHHVYNLLSERDRLKGKGWAEAQIVPLYSPSGPIMEGAGNYGLELAFPGPERVDFEARALYKLIGVDPPKEYTPDSAQLRAARRTLDNANIHAAREYLDGRMSREDAVAFLMKFNHDSESRARQRMDFADKYRGYVINYTLGQYVIADYVEARVAGGEDPWDVFKYILDTPLMISDLQSK